MSISKNHVVDRSRVNETAVNAVELPKSGFNKSYKTYTTLNMGRLHVGGYHHIMPADKFRGENQASLTFFRLNQPNISDVNISQHNFFVTLRALDKTFEDAFAPGINNAMSASWTAPCFSLQDIVRYILTMGLSTSGQTALTNLLGSISQAPTVAITAGNLQVMKNFFSNNGYFNTSFGTHFENQYCGDWYTNVFIPRGLVLVNTIVAGTTTNNDAYQVFVDALFGLFIGEGSLLDELGYIYVRRSDLKQLAVSSASTIDKLVTRFNSFKQNEYAIRAYYAVWYEYYRDNNLEPKRSTLIDWHNFGSTSVVASNLSMLVIRFRSWTRDMFVTSMPDDICRHVYAPIVSRNASTNNVIYSTAAVDYNNAENTYGMLDAGRLMQFGRNIVSQELGYRDPVTGNDMIINCPLPARVNDVLTASTSAGMSVNMLDLFSLRNAQSLERYLKRNFYFGDEYRDRMLAHYGSYVSDMRVNRPEFLSSSMSPINPNQVVSSAGSSDTPQGERMMTVTASTGSDRYDFFAEEFGIVLNIISVMPVAQYAGVCSQNMLSKVVDYPIPEFAANNEEFGRNYEIAFSGLNSFESALKNAFGHYPYAHSWRSRVNEVHKEYLSDLQEYTFRRLFGMDTTATSPVLNSNFIHCKPNLGMFAAGHDSLWTPQVYGAINHSFYVESVLPTPVETI